MRAIYINTLANGVAAKSPLKIRTYIYQKLGLQNCEEIRKNVYIQNIKALRIGKNSFINSGTKIYNGFDSRGRNGLVTVGSNVTIGYGVSIFSTTHKIGRTDQRADFNEVVYKSVEIEDGTWICANCTILPGVKIGQGCVIAAGAVVISDCEENCLYGGNPAHKIKSI